MQPRADDERAVRAHDGDLLGGDVGDRRAQPARVLEADVRQHLDLGRDDVRRVVAAAETGLDHRRLHTLARELVVGRRGQRLELRDGLVLG